MTALVKFYGSSLAELFTRECAESLDGVCTFNLVQRAAGEWPAGFTHASPPPQICSNSMWTRDAGVFLRELVHWGRIEEARLVAGCLLDVIEPNADGYFSFPERFETGHSRHGRELDGTAAIVIACVLLAERLPQQDALGRRVDDFLKGERGPLAFMVRELGAKPLLAGSGEFGPGCYLAGTACNVVQNRLCALALEAGGRWAKATGDYCGKYLFVFDGQTCPEHGHRRKHETFFVVKGKVRMRCGGRAKVMTEGDVLPVPPGRKHSFTGIGPALLLELSMPCEIADNSFSNPRIPIGRAS